MKILISIIIISPLIYNNKPQKHYDNSSYHSSIIKMHSTYPYHDHDHTSIGNKKNYTSTNKVSLDTENNQVNLICSYETDHGLFKFSNKPVLECADYNAENNLNLDIDPDLLDVSSCVLTDYFELYPNELERILNEGANHLNEESYSIEDMNILNFTNESAIENISKEVSEINTFKMNSSPYQEKFIGDYLTENVITDSGKQNFIIFNGENTIERENNITVYVAVSYIDTLKYDINQYIKCKMTKHYQDFYSQRLKDITNDINLLGKFQKKITFASYDYELEEALRLLFTKFDDDKIFDQKTCNSFVKEFKVCLQKFEESHYHNWCRLSFNEKKLMSYYEFMKLYRLVYRIPEILTLGGLLTERLFDRLAFIFHLINLFIEKIGKPEENHLFIKYLIYKAFLDSHKFKVDLFLVQKLYINCRINHENFNFFSWEIHRQHRHKIKQETTENNHYMIDQTDIVHIKIIFLLFFYQHNIFLKYYRVIIEDISTLIDFIKRITNTDECVMCIFDDFLKLVKVQTDKLK